MFFGCAFRKGAVALFFGVLTVGIIGETAQAQDEDPEDCTILCSPELALEPAVDFEPVVGAARTVEFEGGQPVDTTEAELETPFELTLAMGIPTQWPRLELGIDASWTPTTDANENPFTGEDGLVIEFEASLDFAATGIPQDGDRFSDELFLDDESPWGVSMALVLPLAPLN